VKEQKTRTRPEEQSKNKENTWKNKSKAQSQELKLLRQRNKELAISRDLWKNKYYQGHSSGLVLGGLDHRKARCHQYELWVILLLLEWYSYGSTSLRSCRHNLLKMVLVLGIATRIPSHNSLRNWLCKSGYYRLEGGLKSTASMVIFVDESIVIGGEKVLLILGTPSSNICSQRALVHEDMMVLYVGFGKEWKSEMIEAKLETIAKRNSISYVVSDRGTNLVKCFQSGAYVNVSDITHVFANELKRLYEKDETFVEFTKLIGQVRKAWYLSSEKSQYIPPKMRTKLRFANLFPCVDWAIKMLQQWAELDEQITEKLMFLKQQEAFIQTLNQLQKIFKDTCELLKNQGFSMEQKTKALAILASTQAGEKTQIFIKNVVIYLEDLTQKMIETKQDHIICCSDIIESFFGKFKEKANTKGHQKLTEFVFTIANFSNNFNTDEIKQALEFSKVKDFKNLIKDNNKTIKNERTLHG
jgi:hypothetical protein